MHHIDVLLRSARCVILHSQGGPRAPDDIDVKEVKKRIISGDLPIRPIPEYEAVMAPYRGTPADVSRHIEVVRRHGPTGIRLVIDQDGGLLADYPYWAALQWLVENDPAFAWLLYDARQNCVVRVVMGPEDGRRQIRQLHIDRNDSAIKGRDYDRVIADQIRDSQDFIDTNWEEWARADPKITGRFRLASNFVGRLLGVGNKRVDRVLAREPDLQELLYLKVMDVNGDLQKGKARPGDATRRGRKPRGDSGSGGAKASVAAMSVQAFPEAGELQVGREKPSDGPIRDSAHETYTNTGQERALAAVHPLLQKEPTSSVPEPASAKARVCREPTYELGWELHALLRETHEDDEALLDRQQAMAEWFCRVQVYLRTVNDRGDRRQGYQRILFLGLGLELSQRLMVDDLATFFATAEDWFGRIQDAYPVLFDHIEPWVIEQAADWWLLARQGTYYIPRPDGSIYIRASDPSTPDSLRLADLPSYRVLDTACIGTSDGRGRSAAASACDQTHSQRSERWVPIIGPEVLPAEATTALTSDIATSEPVASHFANGSGLLACSR